MCCPLQGVLGLIVLAFLYNLVGYLFLRFKKVRPHARLGCHHRITVPVADCGPNLLPVPQPRFLALNKNNKKTQ